MTSESDVPESGERLRALLLENSDKESIYQQLVENSLDAILISDEYGVYIGANHATEILFGVSRDHLIGKRRSELIHEAPPRSRAAWAESSHGSNTSEEVVFFRPDGEKRYAEYRTSRFAPGLRLSILRDVTERRRAEDALRQSREQYRALIEAMPQIVWTANAYGELEFISSQWTEYSGCDLWETLARGWETFVHPDDLEMVLKVCRISDETGLPFQSEYRLRGADGAYLWFLLRGVPLSGADGKVARWFGTVTNIDVQKRAENAQRFLAELGLRVRPIVEPLMLIRAVTESVGKYLDVSRCAFVEVDEGGDTCSIYPAYHNGSMPDLAGTYPLTGFGSEVVETLRGGKTLFIQDSAQDPRTSSQFHAAYQSLNVRSMLCVPLIKEHQWVGALSVVTNDAPRDWTGGEAELLEQVVEQLWLALENVRLYQASRKEVERRQQAESIIRRQFERLSALRAIDSIIASSRDLQLTLQFCIDEIMSLLKVDAAGMVLFDAKDDKLQYVASRGFWHYHEEHHCKLPAAGIIGRIVLQRSLIRIPDVPDSLHQFAYPEIMTREAFVSYIGVPLIARGHVVGVLEVFHRTPLDPDDEWIAFIHALAAQAAIATENASLFESLEQTNAELRDAYEATIEGWSRALDLRDNETEGHSQRVTTMTVTLVRSLGVSEEHIVHIRRGALLHDIGKMGIPDKILRKPAALNKKEQEIMRRHPQYAYDLLSPISFLREALEIPYCHHEKWDGTGYPRGLKGEEIPLAARIFAVADVWDALCSDRPYRKAWSPEVVLDYIQEMAGSHFDPAIVKAFLAQRVMDAAE